MPQCVYLEKFCDSNIGTPPPRLAVLFRKDKSATHTNTRVLKWGCVDIVIVLFVLGMEVGVTMGGGSVI